jgi:hypothetical protein
MKQRWTFICSALVLACAACGSNQVLLDTKLLDADSTLSVFRQAGFRNLIVLDHGGDSSTDTIATRGGPYSMLAPLLAVRFATVEQAKRRLANDQPLLNGRLSRQQRSVLPHEFDVARLVDVRVCNVVMSSYNTNKDAALASRIDRAVRILRQKC